MASPNYRIGTELIDTTDGLPVTVSATSPSLRVVKRIGGTLYSLPWRPGRFRRATARRYVFSDEGLKRKREAARRRRLRADEAAVRLLAAANRLTFEEAMEALA